MYISDTIRPKALSHSDCSVLSLPFSDFSSTNISLSPLTITMSGKPGVQPVGLHVGSRLTSHPNLRAASKTFWLSSFSFKRHFLVTSPCTPPASLPDDVRCLLIHGVVHDDETPRPAVFSLEVSGPRSSVDLVFTPVLSLNVVSVGIGAAARFTVGDSSESSAL